MAVINRKAKKNRSNIPKKLLLQKEFFKNDIKFLDKLVDDFAQQKYYMVRDPSRDSVMEKIRADKEGIKNEGMRQDIALKKVTLLVLFIFLGLETIAIFAFSYFQATRFFGFNLEEWSFRLLVTATILQITFMLQVAVKHLFPAQREK
ncbi:MAG: hypothetical protein HQ538_00455 [Parcubacteria group bacterium]|nr:hypothetical protein [Parcubacteria group bacterium]